MFSEGRKKPGNPVVPSCVFTEPQIASVGVKENDAAAGGRQFKAHKFDFRANAMAHILDEAEGFVKIITEQENNRIIGASIVGPQASELIAVLAVAINSRLTASQVREMIFAHPTLSESIHESVN
jgi:dihydrolipoamide dehydrogenase